MILVQFQLTKFTDEEVEIAPEYCEWVCEQIYSEIETKINRLKIENRFKYLYTVPWIRWVNKKELNTDTVMEAIKQCITYEIHRDNIYNIVIDNSLKIPNTSTSIVRLLRFINYGDYNYKATGIFTNIQNNYKHQKLNSLWQLFIMDELGYLPESIIISK